MDGSLDLSEFEAAQTAQTAHVGPTCRYALLALSPERQAQLEHVMHDRPDIKPKAISKVLAGWECPIPWQTIARHRRGDCLCGKNGKT
jgi:hypothetical protein